MRTHLTETEQELIHRMIFGSFEKEWFVNGVLDNRDAVIAKRISRPTAMVGSFISKIVTNHFNEVNQRINKKQN